MIVNKERLVWKIAVLGVPLVVGQLGLVFQSFADTIMVGNYGTMELSASGFVGNLFNLVIFFLVGVSYSTTPIVGALFGRKDYCGTARTLRESLLVNGLMGMVVSALLAVLYFYLDRLGQPVELLPLIRPYFLTQLASIPFLALFNAMKQFSDALGKTRISMWIMLTSNVLNVILNYVMIFGVCGFPEWGLIGAGVATFVARAFLPLAMAVVLMSNVFRPYVKGIDGIGTKQNREALRVTRFGVIHLLTVGLPIAVQLCLEASSFNISALFMGWLGAIPLAAHQVMCTISTLCFQILYGVGGAAAILVSQYRGQNDWIMVRRVVKTAYMTGLLCAVVMISFISLGFHQLSILFTTSEEVVGVLMTILPCFMVYQFGDCTQILFANVLRGMEAVRRMMLYAFIAYILISLPLSYFFAFILEWGSAGVWWGLPFGLSTAGLLFWLEYRRELKHQSR